MKLKTAALSRNYLSALRRHLRGFPESSLKGARTVGAKALALGLSTPDLARIHEESLAALLLPPGTAKSRNTLGRHAGAFFAEAITPIEATQHGTLQANAQLKLLVSALTQRTVELAASNKELKHEVMLRLEAEKSLRGSEETTRRLLEKSRQLQQELRLLSRRLLSVQEEERKRISRELHDVIAQTLTGINLRLATLKAQTITDAKNLRRNIAVTQRLVARSVDIVHRFAQDLRPSVLDDLGLLAALEAYVAAYRKQTGITVAVSTYAGVERLDNAVRTVLFRIVQEALSNVAQHSGADQAVVTITRPPGMVRMEITDPGRGFEVSAATFSRDGKHLGLLGMRERTEMIGGTFAITSSPGTSTRIRVEIPLPQSRPPSSARLKARRKSSRKITPATNA